MSLTPIPYDWRPTFLVLPRHTPHGWFWGRCERRVLWNDVRQREEIEYRRRLPEGRVAR